MKAWWFLNILALMDYIYFILGYTYTYMHRVSVFQFQFYVEVEALVYCWNYFAFPTYISNTNCPLIKGGKCGTGVVVFS